MSNNDACLNIWNMMDISDKKYIMHEFLRKNDDRFNREEFLKFLADRHEKNKRDSASVIIIEQR